MNIRALATILSAGLATGAFVMPAAAFAQGTLAKIQGQAQVQRGGQQVSVREGDSVGSGDTLFVGPQGKAEIRFADDSVFFIRGPTRLRIDAFQLPSPGAGGKALYTLLEGGLRTVTGKISKGAQDQYEMRVDEATITVAGSAYSVLRCAGSCAGGFKQGLYVRAESGVITVTNSAGESKLRAGQKVYVADSAVAPVATTVSPFQDPPVGDTASADAGFKSDAESPPPRVKRDPVPSPSEP